MKKLKKALFLIVPIVLIILSVAKRYVATTEINCPFKIEQDDKGIYNAFQFVDRDKITEFRQSLLEKDLLLKVNFEFDDTKFTREAIFSSEKSAKELETTESFAIIKSSVEKAGCTMEYKVTSGWYLRFFHLQLK